MDNKSYIEKNLKEAEPSLDEGAIEKFFLYANEIKEWNKKFNLTSITDEKQIIVKHFMDSLYLLKIDTVSHCETLLDLGSGAGLPGIPLAIAQKQRKIILVESNNKKISFLEHIKKLLRLNNISIINSRAEDMSRKDKFKQKFDCALTRALAKFPISMEISIGLIKEGGFIAYYASQKQKDEINQQQNVFDKLKCKIALIYDYSLPENTGEHCIIIVKKMWKTDSKYPRQYSRIIKKPL